MDSEIVRLRFLPPHGHDKKCHARASFLVPFPLFSYSSKSRLNPAAFGFVLFFCSSAFYGLHLLFRLIFCKLSAVITSYFFEKPPILTALLYSFFILSLQANARPSLFLFPLRLKTLFLPFLWYLQQLPFYSALSLQFIVSSFSFYFDSRWTPLPSAKSLFCF